ncbi:protein CHROMATIN REMODELING 4-like [Hibiscus syriacus]|uniref:protein CHROMATIN REMODELING 4-like n=1 Tax=Hibiscus syriacus TaxID=106335 RepID=UPI0019245FA3|nr:protein CHROMATIN REMODELING 4-like [Hibiscus syriacus]
MPDPKPSLVSCILTMKSNKEEANGEHRVDGKNHGASGGAGSSQINDNHNNSNGDADVDDMCNGNVNGDVHADIDDTADSDEEEMVDRCARGNNAGDCIVVDWLEGEYCFECNSTSGQILVCRESGCPVAFHEACLTWTPKFDEMSKFYCPYCLYKQEVARLKELRQKVMLAEKESSNFICLRRDGGNEEGEGEMVSFKRASASTMAREVSSGDCGNGLNDDDKVTTPHNQDEIQGVELISKEKSYEGNISTTHGSDKVGNGERMHEDIENPNSEDNETDEGEPVLPNAVGTTFHRCQKDDKQTANKASSFQPSSSANNMDLNHEGNNETAKTSAKWQKSTKRSLMPCTEKRRRLHWTAEEEDMLKELMQEYSTKANKNIPWRKILEHGRSVFHSTRLPVDLKDKWKNIVSKEISKR